MKWRKTIINPLLSQFLKNARDRRNDPFIIDQDGKRLKTFRDIDLISDRVAAYLQKNGFGRECVIGIHLPKGMEYIAAELGIMKAGAAFLPLDYSAASDRRDFIIRDSECRLLITPEVFLKMQEEEAVSAPVETDPHDLAFIVYTSGSSGVPKGVEQEYGAYTMQIDSLRNMWNAICPHIKSTGQTQFVLTAPLYFVASIEILGLSLIGACCLHVISGSTLLDLKKLKNYISSNAIDVGFFTPSLLRKAGDPSQLSLSVVLLGAEPAIGLYCKKPVLINDYSSSELAFVAAFFEADRLYENMPVGPLNGAADIRLVDEDRTPVSDKGVMCVHLPFFRGYHNMPEKTAEIIMHIDGKRFYYTGDVASVDENGIYTVHGRADNMIKVNGNRVETGEVENAIYKAFPGISRTAVKGFLTRNHTTYICAFYTASYEIPGETFRRELTPLIMPYMIPRFFVRMKAFPLTPTGKIAMNELKAPDEEQYRADYAVPENAEEELLCREFGHVLSIDKIGRYDDFYRLGGDSLATMSLITALPYSGISFSEIIEGKTPEGIAALCRKRNIDLLSDHENTGTVIRKDYPLGPVQLWFFDLQLIHPKSTGFNLSALLLIPPEINIDTLISAVREVIRHHKTFGAKFFFDKNSCDLRIRFTEERREIRIRDLSEEKFAEMKKSLIRPYNLVDEFLYRVEFYRTEKANYLFMDAHHMIIDGTSIQLVYKEIDMLCRGNKLPEEEPGFACLTGEDILLKKDIGGKQFWNMILSKSDPNKYCLPADFNTGKDEACELTFAIKNLDAQYFSKTGFSENVFFLTAALLTDAEFLGRQDAFISWVYNGRDTKQKADTIGLLIHEMPLYQKLPADMTVKDLIQHVQKNLLEEVSHAHSDYFIYGTAAEDHDISFMYQEYIHARPIICDRELPFLDIKNEHKTATNLLDVEIWRDRDSDGFLLYLNYNSGRYYENTIRRFADLYINNVKKMKNYPDLTIGDLKRTVSD